MQSSGYRLQSIDIVRGGVMILMALDHVRVFAGVPPGGPDPGVYFTRWITHFCAPAFVFLAGTGAFLHGTRLNDRPALSRWLAIRGALLIFFELTISRLGWTFNLDFYNYTEANVIWAIGWAMIVLSLLVRLRPMMVGAIGLVIVAGHHVLQRWAPNPWEMPPDQVLGWLWQLMYVGGEFRLFGTGPKLVVLYTLIPWIGVIAAGYWFGVVMAKPEAERRRACHWIGWGAIITFVVLRWSNLYGDPQPWAAADEALPTLMSFLWTNKYPASLLFLLMTLGPVIALLPWLERAHGKASGWFTTFGREPLFFYLLHIPFIHLTTVLISLARTPGDTGWLFENHPLRVPPVPEGYMYSLPLLYLVWFAVVIALYFPTRWFAQWPARRTSRWLKYF